MMHFELGGAGAADYAVGCDDAWQTECGCNCVDSSLAICDNKSLSLYKGRRKNILNNNCGLFCIGRKLKGRRLIG
jgi:hypothetical protein